MPRIPVPSSVEDGLDGVLDRAMQLESPVVDAYLARIRRTRPHASPADVVEILEDRYRKAAVGVGAASGAVAAVPGAGTVTSLSTAGVEIAAYVSATGLYALAVARVYGVPIHDPEVRRALVFGVLLGEGSALATEGTQLQGKHWAGIVALRANKVQLAGLNGKFTKMVLTRFTARQAGLAFARTIPMGIGAGIGAIGNAALARLAIRSARRAFGPPPAVFPESFPAAIVDATATETRPGGRPALEI